MRELQVLLPQLLHRAFLVRKAVRCQVKLIGGDLATVVIEHSFCAGCQLMCGGKIGVCCADITGAGLQRNRVAIGLAVAEINGRGAGVQLTTGHILPARL